MPTPPMPLSLAITALLITISQNRPDDVGSNILLSAALTNLLAIAILTERSKKDALAFGAAYNGFFLLTYWFVKTNSLLTFFVLYELFLLPSAILVLRFSPGKKGSEAFKYFLI